MITVEQLSKSYGSSQAVRDLSFTVPDAAVTGFLGPNGSGKSTTMRCILGLDRPTSGRALVDGVPFATVADKASVAGAVLEADWFAPDRSGRGHLRVLAAGARAPESRVDEVLELVGLAGTPATKRVKNYSLGMKQRLGLAGALLGRPRHLILDEPVNGLDPEGVSWVRHTIRALAADGCAVLVSSHLLSEMQQTADRIVVIGRGRLIGEYTMHEFLAAGTTVEIETSDDSRLAALLGERGLRPRRTEAGIVLDVPADTDEAEIRSMLAHVCLSEGIATLRLAGTRQNLEQRFLDATSNAQEYRTTPELEGASR